MNRDELRTRVPGNPPRRYFDSGVTVVHPAEPSGGTWLALNDRGVTLALINWYAIPERAAEPVVSRGEVVRAVRSVTEFEQLSQGLADLPLDRMNPFRLLAFLGESTAAWEGRWNRRRWEWLRHPWEAAQWQSSGHLEATAQEVRGATFARHRNDRDAGTVPWLRRLHGSHLPGRGPFSICMHRADAQTVSYTEVEVEESSATLRYCPGSLCEGRPLAAMELKREGNR
ncbi:MAG: hypothetical protein J0M24_23810 [Verrucomicrobia bacterium]|nr:hypothetical protein [Verrucomicrobiota bacterium]